METPTLQNTLGATSAPLGTLSPSDLRDVPNAAFARLARAVEGRNSKSDAVNFSRMHHRHNRSQQA